MKCALVTRVAGQDGAYLARSLLNRGCEVYGTYRRLSTPNFWRRGYLDVFGRVKVRSLYLIGVVTNKIVKPIQAMMHAIETM